LNFQDSKVEGPTTVLEYLGIILDSVKIKARLPLDKLSYLKGSLSLWVSKTHCSLLELQELSGYLMFCSQVIPYSRAFLSSLFESFHFHLPSAKMVWASGQPDSRVTSRYLGGWGSLGYLGHPGLWGPSPIPW
jgi:hypothetical protein